MPVSLLKSVVVACDKCGQPSTATADATAEDARKRAEDRGWRAVATRQLGVVRMLDVCPACAAVTPGAV